MKLWAPRIWDGKVGQRKKPTQAPTPMMPESEQFYPSHELPQYHYPSQGVYGGAPAGYFGPYPDPAGQQSAPYPFLDPGQLSAPYPFTAPSQMSAPYPFPAPGLAYHANYGYVAGGAMPPADSPYMIMIPSKQALAAVMGGFHDHPQQQDSSQQVSTMRASTPPPQLPLKSSPTGNAHSPQQNAHILEQIERQRIEIEQLKNELERQRYSVENHKTKRENQKMVIEQQRHEMEEMRHGIDVQRREIEEMRSGIEQQRLALEGQRNQIEHGLYEHEHQNMEIDNRKHEVEQLKAQIEQYKAECERKNKQLQLLDGECARLENELTVAREKTKDIQESSAKLMDVHTSTQDQFLIMKETNLKLKSFIQDLTLKIHANERDLVSKDRELASLAAKKQSTEEASSIVKGEMKDTKKVLRRTAEVVETQQQLADELQRKLERSTKKEKEHAIEMQTLTAMYEDKIQKMDIAMRRDLHIKTTQSESVLARLNEKVQHLQANLKDAYEKNDALAARVAVYEQDLISAKRKAASLKEQLAFESRLKEMNNTQLQQIKSERYRDERGKGEDQMEAVLNILRINETNTQNLDVVRKDVQDMMIKLAARPPQKLLLSPGSGIKPGRQFSIPIPLPETLEE